MSAITDEAVEAATRTLHPGLFEDDGILHPALALSGQWQARHNVRAALEAALPYLQAQPVASRERVAEVLMKARNEDGRWILGGIRVYDAAHGDLADALLAAGVFSEPQPECGAVDRTGERRCVFTPGHHEAENWTSHGDRGGWTWNDQPTKV